MGDRKGKGKKKEGEVMEEGGKEGSFKQKKKQRMTKCEELSEREARIQGDNGKNEKI